MQTKWHFQVNKQLRIGRVSKNRNSLSEYTQKVTHFNRNYIFWSYEKIRL